MAFINLDLSKAICLRSLHHCKSPFFTTKFGRILCFGTFSKHLIKQKSCPRIMAVISIKIFRMSGNTQQQPNFGESQPLRDLPGVSCWQISGGGTRWSLRCGWFRWRGFRWKFGPCGWLKCTCLVPKTHPASPRVAHWSTGRWNHGFESWEDDFLESWRCFLGGGNSCFFWFAPRTLGFYDPIWQAYIFWNELNPPTSFVFGAKQKKT